MEITPTVQPTTGPSDKPILKDPVTVKLDVPVYYSGSGNAVPTSRLVTCDRAHAILIYQHINDWAVKYGFSLVHLGTYYPRKARKANGDVILYKGKPRWSGHSWGAIDFHGVIASDGKFYDVNALKAQAPAKFAELMSKLKSAIVAAHRKPEIVKEPHWVHCGIVPIEGW